FVVFSLFRIFCILILFFSLVLVLVLVLVVVLFLVFLLQELRRFEGGEAMQDDRAAADLDGRQAGVGVVLQIDDGAVRHMRVVAAQPEDAGGRLGMCRDVHAAVPSLGRREWVFAPPPSVFSARTLRKVEPDTNIPRRLGDDAPIRERRF